MKHICVYYPVPAEKGHWRPGSAVNFTKFGWNLQFSGQTDTNIQAGKGVVCHAVDCCAKNGSFSSSCLESTRRG